MHDGSLNAVTYVYVEDVDAAYEEFKGRGLEPVDAPEDKFYGVREFLVKDPDGYYYAFAQRLGLEGTRAPRGAYSKDLEARQGLLLARTRPSSVWRMR